MPMSKTITTRRASAIVPMMLGAALLARTLSAQEPRPGPRGGPRPVDTPTPTATTLPRDDGEARILEAIERARQGERHANVSEADGRLLRQLAEAINAQRVVELGTSTGESGLYFAMALRKTGGTLHTFDIDPDRLAVARENFRQAGVEDLIVIHEGDAHVEAPKLDDRPIDLLFIDAEKEGYDAYLRELLPLVRPGGLILAHNMRRPNPNPDYLESITSDPALDTTFLLMEGAGMGMTLKKR